LVYEPLATTAPSAEMAIEAPITVCCCLAVPEDADAPRIIAAESYGENGAIGTQGHRPAREVPGFLTFNVAAPPNPTAADVFPHADVPGRTVV
jgi:hypothetical protein